MGHSMTGNISVKDRVVGNDLTPQEIDIVQSQNAEMRKKLRVDKMRKRVMGGMGTAGMDIENPLSNDW